MGLCNGLEMDVVEEVGEENERSEDNERHVSIER